MNPVLKTLVDAALLAPSGDNTQPWRFDIDERCLSITVSVDETRDTSPMNVGQRMARIACGAAIENIVRTARINAWSPELSMHDDPLRVATVTLHTEAQGPGEIEAVLRDRHTNRKLYRPAEEPFRPLSIELSDEESSSVSIEWFTLRDDIRRWANIISRADYAMFRETGILPAFLKNVRFDRPNVEPVDEGLSLGSLELGRVQAFGLPLLAKLPANLAGSHAVCQGLAKHSRRLVESGSGIGAIFVKTDSDSVDCLVGRIMQRVWLSLTGKDLAAQPMMSMPVIRSLLHHGQLSSQGASTYNELTTRQSEVSSGNMGSIAALIRFGYAPHSTARTGRRAAL